MAYQYDIISHVTALANSFPEGKLQFLPRATAVYSEPRVPAENNLDEGRSV